MAQQVRVNNDPPEMRNSKRRPKLLEQMRQKLRTMHYAYRTEQNYTMWVERSRVDMNRR